MPLMSCPRRFLPHVALLLAAALWLVPAALTPAHAGPKKVYYFLLSEVKLAEGIPSEIGDLVRTQLISAITRHNRLIATLPDRAPDPKAQPKLFARFVKKRNIRPYRVNVEVTRYSHDVDAASGKSGGQELTVSLALRTFGETMPQRVMAFTGEGSATIKLEIGKTLHPRDSRFANKDAVRLAIDDALATSLKRLQAKASGKKKGRRKK